MDQLGPADVVFGLDEKIYSPVSLPVLAILFKNQLCGMANRISW